MCTVSFIARQHGYLLAMNRDEKRIRPAGLPPALRSIGGRSLLCPSEPGGGTWISLNDVGVTFALLNWYSVPGQPSGGTLSRGEVVKAISPCDSTRPASRLLRDLPLERVRPFRLVGVFRQAKELMEWRWNGERLVRRTHPWHNRQWTSSGYDEPEAQRLRGKVFKQQRELESFGTLDWLRELHRSHAPEAGPFSICMHRADATTVSYTEIAVSSTNASLKHWPDSPCRIPDGSATLAALDSFTLPLA